LSFSWYSPIESLVLGSMENFNPFLACSAFASVFFLSMALFNRVSLKVKSSNCSACVCATFTTFRIITRVVVGGGVLLR